MDLNQVDIHGDDVGLILYVNLYGNVIDYDKLKLMTDFFADGVHIIEDAAQSFGAFYKGIPSGNLGMVSCLSFDPTKNLPNYGSGGMLLTDDHDVASFARNFKDNGKDSEHRMLGTNSKMSEVDCAQMIVKLKYFDGWQKRRTDIAAYYSEHLAGVTKVPIYSSDVIPSWHKYVIRSIDQMPLQKFLKLNCNIETKIHYKEILPAMAIFNSEQRYEDFPNAKNLSTTSLSLPIYPEMTDAEVECVVESIQKYYHHIADPHVHLTTSNQTTV
jgi:dTDP-4-amino-4,6-dideoxygalactose transaminase